MTAPLPAVRVETRDRRLCEPSPLWLVCALCGGGIKPLEDGDTLPDLVSLARAHQRSEVCR